MQLIIDVDKKYYEACKDAVEEHYPSQIEEIIANGTPITEGDLIMFRTLMTEIANKGLPFEEVLLLIDNANTPTEGEWISVKDKLPDKNDFVLVYDGSDMFVAWYENEGMSEGWHSFDDTYDRYTPIIAWRPLPKAPESEAENEGR